MLEETTEEVAADEAYEAVEEAAAEEVYEEVADEPMYGYNSMWMHGNNTQSILFLAYFIQLQR